RAEPHDAVVALAGYIEIAVGAGGEIDRQAESIARSGEIAEVRARVPVETRDAAVAETRDEHVAAAGQDAVGLVQVRRAARRGEYAGIRAGVRVVQQHLMVQVAADEQP